MRHLIWLSMVFAILFAAPSFAQSIDASGLTAAQVAEIQRQVDQNKAPEAKAKETVNKVNEWAEIGAGIGTGLAAAARETGTVVNEFATTPVGKLTAAVIVYKVMGRDILGVLLGIPLLLGFITIWLCFVNIHLTPPWRYEYDAEGKVKEKYRDRDRMGIANEDVTLMWILSWLTLFVISALIIGLVIF